MNTKNHELLHKELSYQIQGAAMEVRKNFGSGLKESLYQVAFSEELQSRNIAFVKEKAIKIYSPKTGKYIGLYRPDFIVEGKVIVETKAVIKIPKLFLEQIYAYLRNSEFELGYFVNFASPKLYIKRIIFTNDRKPFLLKTLVAISLIFVSFSVCSRARAAVLYSEAAQQDVYEGQTFVMDWFLDTESRPINSLDLKINYSADVINAIEATSGNSLVNLWIKPPAFNNETGEIVLIGGIPNGVNHAKAPIFRSSFKAIKNGTASITLNPGSTVLLNDGLGTSENLKFRNVLFNIYPKEFQPLKIISLTHPDQDQWYADNDIRIKFEPKSGIDYSVSFSSNIEAIPDDTKDEVSENFSFQGMPDGIYYFKVNSKVGPSIWQEAGVYRVQIDKTAPEAFVPQIGSDPSIFENAKFVSFSTVDKTSGISHYKVKLGLLAPWKSAVSPVELKRPLIGNQIKVAAFDNAGNKRIETIEYKGYLPVWLFMVLCAIVLLGLGYSIYKKFQIKNEKN